jgi:hypothetical protein
LDFRQATLTSTKKVSDTIIMLSISGQLANVASILIVWTPIRETSFVVPNLSLMIAAESSKVSAETPLTRLKLVEPTTPIIA